MKVICYISRFADHMNTSLIDELAEFVNFHNRLRKITGVLLIRNKHFFQVIEGENEIIDSLYTRIKMDGRHRDMIKLLDIELDDRVFNDYNSGSFEVLQRYSDTKKLVTYFNWIKNANYLPADKIAELTNNFLNLG